MSTPDSSPVFGQLPCPFVIAEIGGNHEGSMEAAERLTREAVAAGAHAVKFQAYSPSGIVNSMLSPERHAHFRRFALNPDEYVRLARLTRALGAEFMASLWDTEYLNLLDPFIEIHKVGSGDITNYPLVKALALRGKPLCIATAMATLDEITDLIAFLDDVNPDLRADGRLCFMHCVATYGEPLDGYANLRAIETLRRELPSEIAVGYSDHTVGLVAIETAVCMGAQVIEVHFTDDTTRSFRDHHFSKTREILEQFMQFCRRRQAMLGPGTKQPVMEIETAERIREFRRAVYLNREMSAGEVVQESDLATLRPCVGIDARDYFRVVGRRLRRDRKALEQLSWDDFEVEQGGTSRGTVPVLAGGG